MIRQIYGSAEFIRGLSRYCLWAEEILLAQEHYFPATIAEMYDRARMDSKNPLVRQARDRNDKVLERIYIGCRFV